MISRGTRKPLVDGRIPRRLFFPHGDFVGWNCDMKKDAAENGVKNNPNMSPTDFYSYLLQERVRVNADGAEKYGADEVPVPIFSVIHRGRRLFQQWCLDMYCKRESAQLDYMRFNQTSLRADLYGGAADAVAKGDAGNAGKRVVLAPTFMGGPRHMNRMFEDAMAIVAEHGKPSLFVTFTTNPNWREIKESLLPGQTAKDRPDIVARVFNLKLNALLKDLTVDGCFGAVKAHAYSADAARKRLLRKPFFSEAIFYGS